MMHPLSSLSRRLGTAAAVVAAVLIFSPTRVAAQLQVAITGDTCTSSASETEINDGLQIVSDFRCLTEGGDGCFDGICRYCKSESTDKYPNYVLCEQLAGGNQDFGVSTDPLNPPRDSTRDTPTQNNLGGYGICPYRIGDEDLAQGIQLVGDANCGENKDGCFNDQCRYCKYSETTKSSQYVTCNSLGYNFDPASVPARVPVSAMGDTIASLQLPVPVDVRAPIEPLVLADAPTPAPVLVQRLTDAPASVLAPVLQPSGTLAPPADTGCPYAVTSGDFDVGIQLVGDASCLAGGGVGCFQNACRYCRFGVPTPQSSGFVSCADLGYAFDAISPTTSGSDPTLAPPVLALPPSIVVDTSLVATTDTPPNPPGTPAPTQVTNLSTDCAFVVSDGDFAAGIQLVGDETCAAGSRGCFQDVCRFCKFRNTPQSRHMVPCGDLGYPQFGTPGPTNNSDPGCPYDVSTGDAAVGINLVGDDSCATTTGGLGCFENVCRYCKEWDTPQSKHLLDCADVMAEQTYPPTWAPADVADPMVPTDAIDPALEPGSVVQTPAPNVADPTTAPVTPNAIAPAALVTPNTPLPALPNAAKPTRPAPVTPKTTRPAATIKPITVKPVATTKPVAATKPMATNKPKTRAPAPTRTASSATGCVFAASHSDIAAGVQLVGDKTCARGGIGCFGSSCRYCKFRKTKRSKTFVACASLGFRFDSVQLPATTTAVRTHKPTRAPSLPHVATAGPTLSTDCPFVVSDGDFAVGIKLVGDTLCANGGLGCFQGVCRYCKFKETPQSAHWVRCTDYTVVPPIVVMATAPPQQPTPQPLMPQPTTPAVFSVNPIVINPTPATAVEAPVAGVPILPSDFDMTPASCDEAVAIEDVFDGIDVVPDRSCLGGGSSCIPNSACRYCMRWLTKASQGLIPCDDIPPILVGVRLASVATTAENPVNQLLKERAFQWFIVVAACVGVVAVAALTALGAKRTVARCGSILGVGEASTKRAAATSSETPRPSKSHSTVVTSEDSNAVVRTSSQQHHPTFS